MMITDAQLAQSGMRYIEQDPALLGSLMTTVHATIPDLLRAVTATGRVTRQEAEAAVMTLLQHTTDRNWLALGAAWRADPRPPPATTHTGRIVIDGQPYDITITKAAA